jgi:hypothetical protein
MSESGQYLFEIDQEKYQALFNDSIYKNDPWAFAQLGGQLERIVANKGTA